MESAGGHDDFARACELVRDSRRALAFTGAGISAESGIPTYRDAGGALWSRYDPETYANINYFRRDPSLFWRFFQDVRYHAITDAAPNSAHRVLAALEDAGRLRAVITQNIDGLHQAAGSREVIELHGNTRVIGCLDCGRDYTMDEVYAQLRAQLPPPCRACGGMLKPRVVFFGEELPPAALLRAAEAVRACDLLLAIGSSLVVYPAALLPSVAKRQGARLIIINKTPTQSDSEADAVLRRPAGEVLPELARAAGVEIAPDYTGRRPPARGARGESL